MKASTNGNTNLRRLTLDERPEGKTKGVPGEFVQCSDGTLWKKGAGRGKIGWEEIGTAGTGIQSIVAGTNITIDDTDPANPIINATGGTGQILALYFTTNTGQRVYIFDGTVNSYNPGGIDLRTGGDATFIQLFSDGQLKTPPDDYDFNSSNGAVTFVENIQFPVPVTLNIQST